MRVLKRSGTGKRRTGSKKSELKAAGERETVQTKRKGKAKRGRESDLSDTIKVNTISGGNGERVPPVPIPNTEVKPLSADGTWLETARESRSPPDSNINDYGESQDFSESLFLSSSMAEHSAVNRVVVGSSPTWGATDQADIDTISA